MKYNRLNFPLVTLAKNAKNSVFSETLVQSCKSGQAFRIGFGPKVDQGLGLIRA